MYYYYDFTVLNEVTVADRENEMWNGAEGLMIINQQPSNS